MDRERERLRACWLLCGIGVVYWPTAMQASTSLVLFAEQRTELELCVLGRSLTVLAGHSTSLHAALVLVLAPPLGWAAEALLRDQGHGRVCEPVMQVVGLVIVEGMRNSKRWRSTSSSLRPGKPESAQEGAIQNAGERRYAVLN